MAVHAAMVDRMDQGIGEVLDALERSGQLDNTLILFLSDNGCSNEVCENYEPGENDRPDMTRDGRPMVYPRHKEVMPGPETTYASIGARWANVANTPFRFWKAKSYEGGICTPMIAYWPKGINKKSVGGFTTQVGHVMDIMATCVDLAKATYPTTYKGHQIIPMEGISLTPIFKQGQRRGHDYLGFEHFNQRAFLSEDGWKLVEPGNGTKWELYNLNIDRSEQHNLADQYPERVATMVKAYEAWAKRCMVEPYPGQRK
jgi:arylsulfatase